MEILTPILEILVIVGIMVFVCFFTSGVEWGLDGSIFEKKSTPAERAAKEAKEAGTIRGGKKQPV